MGGVRGIGTTKKEKEALTTEASEKQELETDVVVVGYGGAGAVAAITAHDNGARVIVIEKMPAGGGNTRVSTGVLFAPKGARVVQYLAALCLGTTENDIIETFVANALKNEEWIKGIGGETEPRPSALDVLYPTVPVPSWSNVPGGEAITRYKVKGTRIIKGKREVFGENLWQLLSSNVERRGITVMTGTPARELITNENGEVVGVRAERGGKSIAVMAKRAVILTCGGFQYNESMKQAFLSCSSGNSIYGLGSPGNTGDGIVMAQRVGAALWHMTAADGPLGFKAPEYEVAFHTRIYGGRFLYVDLDGKRFTNETGPEGHDLMWKRVSVFDTSRFRYPRIPVHAIFDDVTRRRGPINTQAYGISREYEWSLDNSKEIAKGWISRGKTIGELARKISIDESALENTISAYNQFCNTGKDTDFGRSKASLEPIEEAPYYAINLSPCLINTQGGPRRDKNARVLNCAGKPIPRLYSAGELGSIWGFMLEASGSLTECLAFGRIAGQSAAAEKSWL